MSDRGSFIGSMVNNEQDVINSYTCDIYQDPSKLELQSGRAFDANFKLILIGNSGVGKSCIIDRKSVV